MRYFDTDLEVLQWKGRVNVEFMQYLIKMPQMIHLCKREKKGRRQFIWIY